MKGTKEYIRYKKNEDEFHGKLNRHILDTVSQFQKKLLAQNSSTSSMKIDPKWKELTDEFWIKKHLLILKKGPFAIFYYDSGLILVEKPTEMRWKEIDDYNGLNGLNRPNESEDKPYYNEYCIVNYRHEVIFRHVQNEIYNLVLNRQFKAALLITLEELDKVNEGGID